ncbi:MAG: hypothetical protein H8E66_04995 [Planctomycetes bacterium]|nr:hypothetical protein [Planctomycetota bacterium]
MKLIKCLRGFAVAAATFGILLPHPAITNAGEKSNAKRQLETVRDLALGAGGVLKGQAINKDGVPDAGATVSVIQDGETITMVKADEKGGFAVAGMTGGVYGITSGKATGVVRAWAHRTAPPAASQGILLVPNDLTVRGQGNLHDLIHNHNLGGLSLGQIGLGGLLVLGLIGTIVAVTLDDAS